MRILGRISLVYGVFITLAGAFLLASWVYRADLRTPETLFYRSFLLLHGIGQWYFSWRTLRMQDFPRHFLNGTLDGDLMAWNSGKRVYAHPGWLIGAMAIASFIELVIAGLGLTSLQMLPHMVSAGSAEDFTVALIHVSGVAGALPSVAFNLRAWRYRWLLPAGRD